MTSRQRFERRAERTRYHLKKKASSGRYRLSVFRSGLHISCQVIDDQKSHTLVSASTLEKGFADVKASGVEKAKKVGELLAERALKKKIDKVFFDRGGFLYHGRVKALADSARNKGLSF